MAKNTVTLLRHCKTPDGWLRLPVAVSKNGRVRPGYAIHNGAVTEYPQGSYVIRWYEDRRTLYKNVGTEVQEALAARDRQILKLNALDAAQAAGTKLVEEETRARLRAKLEAFVQRAVVKGSLVAAGEYRRTATAFLQVTGRVFADEVMESDIALFMQHLRKRGCADRTCNNQHRHLKSFLKFAGVEVGRVVPPAPRYEKQLPAIYNDAELATFFSSLQRADHRLLFLLLLQTGLREQEAMFLEWGDIELTSRPILTLHSKPEVGFRIKDREERQIPIPSAVAALLLEKKGRSPKTRWVLGTSGDAPNTHMLRLLKRLVRRAGLNCQRCAKCKQRKECEKWFLHKFRATYCTKLLRSGMDLRSVQALMGHSDIESTMRYLRPQETEHSQDAVNAVNWGYTVQSP